MSRGSVGSPERHTDGLQRIAPAVPGIPVQPRAARVSAAAVVVAAVREEVATVAPSEAAEAVSSGTIMELQTIVVAVESGELLVVLPATKRVSAGVASVATEANTVVVAFIGNVETVVLGVAVLTFPVKQVDT